MKYKLFIIAALTTFLSVEMSAQPVQAERTEVIVPNALSFYNGKGAGEIHFSDSLNGISFIAQTPFYGLTTDGGGTWKDGKTSVQLDQIMKMYSIGRDSIVAIRDSQFVYHSYNGGESWSLAATLWAGEKFNNGLFFNHRYAVNFTSNNELLISSDLGISWLQVPWQYRDVKPTLFYNNGYLFVTEDPQYPLPAAILFSTNNGISWNRTELPSTIFDYTFIAKGEAGFIIGTYNGVVYHVSPGGEILKRLTSPGNAQAYGYSFVSDSEIWCLDNDINYYTAGIARYSVTDSTATYLPLNFRHRFMNQFAVTTWDKFVLGSNYSPFHPAVMVIHREGLHDLKVEQYKLPGNVFASCLYFINDSKGFAATSKNAILKTTDGGDSWIETSVPVLMATITSFARKSDSEIIAICEGGDILESNDEGNSWQTISSAFRGSIKRAAFAGRDTIFFCTEDSLYMTTPSWQQITPVYTGLSGGTFQNLNFYDSYNGSATYPSSNTTSDALITTDRGATWQKQSFPGRIFTLDPGTLGLLYNSSDGVTAWYEESAWRYIGITSAPTLVDQSQGGFIALTGNQNHLIFNRGSKINWKDIYLGPNIEKKQIVAAGENNIFLLSENGKYWKFSRSTDSPPPTTILRNYPVDGSPYEFHNLLFRWEEPWTVAPVTEYHFQLALGDTSNIVENITGFDSTSCRVTLTADSSLYFWRVRAANKYGWGSFNPWYSFKSSTIALEAVAYQTPLVADLTASIILPDGRLMVGNSRGEIARTDQLPINWTTVTSGTTFPILRFYHDPGNGNVFYLTNGNFIAYSTNRGYSWIRKEAPFGSTMITSLAPLQPNKLFGTGYYGSIFQAGSGPASWTRIWFAPSYGNLLSASTMGSDKIAAVGEYGNVTLSDDGGQTFRYIGMSQQEVFKKVSFARDGTIVILNKNGERRTSTDMGYTWKHEYFEIRTPIRDMVTRNGVSVVVDSLGGIYTSLSPTDPWRYSKLPEGSRPMGVEISGQTILISARYNKLFLVPLNSGNPTGIEDGSTVTHFTLSQNYPNPFNASTVIGFTIASPGSYVLEVFNTMGEKVATLHEGWFEKGTYREHFNSGELASGIYLYRLRGNGVVLTSKMLILK